MKIATVCTGIGSPEQALENLEIDHEIVFGCEIDKYARQTYLANFNPKMILEDMTKETWEGSEYYADLFIGSIPCQAFSLAGKRLGELDPRGLLFYDFYRYVKVQQPKFFIIENVKGLLSDNDGATFRNWINLLGQSENGNPLFFPHEDSLMYNLHWQVLNTKDYGLPQNRERVFLVGIRNDLPNDFVFPKGVPLTKRLKDVLESNVDEKYYLSDKIVQGFVRKTQRDNEKGNGFKFNPKDNTQIADCITSRSYKMSASDNYIKVDYINQDTQASQVYSENGISPTLISGTHGYAMEYVIGAMRGRNPDNPKSRQSGLPTEQMLAINKEGVSNTLTSVQKDNLVVENWIRGGLQQNQPFQTNGISPCLTSAMGTGGGQTPIHNYGGKIRRLTPLECFRLQGFPDSFVKVVSDSQLYKQAGNTISVPVIQAILKNLLK